MSKEEKDLIERAAALAYEVVAPRDILLARQVRFRILCLLVREERERLRIKLADADSE